MKKEVSILSIVCNHEKYLHEFFNGILSQKLAESFELIVGVDKCTDQSKAICLQYQQQYPGLVKVIVHQELAGMFNNFLSVYQQCTGKYIAICEGDDYWTDEFKLQKQLAALRQNQDAVLCFTDIKIFDDDLKSYHPNWATIKKNVFTIDDLIEGNMIATCTVLFRNILTEPFSEAFTRLPMVDWPLFVNLARHGKAIYLQDTTAVYRRNSLSIFAKNPILQQLQKKEEVYQYFLQEPLLACRKKKIEKAYYLNLYAIAVRLSETNRNKRANFNKIIKHALLHANPALLFKSFVRRLIKSPAIVN
ncbi:MAG: glycosyl transferase, family 2 [Ferruginibacter sp.]|nr:glycosyl transferase, family 2 [Ferruginibacter sp.]